MRRVAIAAILAIATVIAVLSPAMAQVAPGRGGAGRPPPPTVHHNITVTTALSGYAIGGFVCAVVSPMIGTVMLNREMTSAEVGRSTLSCFLGPVGWMFGPSLFPDVVVAAPGRTNHNPPAGGARQPSGRNTSFPPLDETKLVRNEILLEFASDASPQLRERIARDLQLIPQDIQTFTLTGRTLTLLRIHSGRSVADTRRGVLQYPGVVAAQPNYLYRLQQAQPTTDAGAAQYVVSKLHLLDVHRISNGDNVLVAVIDSQIDTGHPDLAGVIAGEYDAVGTTAAPHSHGTAMAGAIAAHSKLIGVAPKVRLLAVRAFSGEGENAQSTSFSLLKAIDWAAANKARVINMSFAGPADAMVRAMLGKANERGIVLIAAVGNAGPGSPPLFPAADAHVIGMTATDADDKLLPQANRGPQVALAAPGVEILAVAPNGGYQVTSGTSVAAAHASGVVALLLARNAQLTPDQVRRALVRSAHAVAGKRGEFGAGVIDALGAVNSLRAP